MKARALLIYHNKDLDGFCSAFIMHEWLAKQGYDVLMVGHDYNDPEPHLGDLDQYALIYMVDITLPDHIMGVLMEEPNFVLIDHHVSARKKIERINPDFCVLPYYFYDQNQAACEICASYTKSYDEYEIVKEIARWDIHRDCHKEDFEETATIQLGLNVMLPDPNRESARETWRKLLDKDENILDEALIHGTAIREYIRKNNQKIGLGFIELDDRKFQAFHCLPNRYAGDNIAAPKAFCFFQNGKWVYSLRGDNVLPVAEKRGGGGHPNACGFSSILNPSEIK